MNWQKQLHIWIILGLVLGLGYGILSAAMGWGEFTQNWISPFGDIFLNSLFMIAVPLVLGSIITGISSLSDTRKLARIGGKTIAIYIGTTVFALIIGLILVNIVRPGDTVPEDVRTELQAEWSDMAEERQESAASAEERGPLQAFVDMVPRNIAAAASNNRNMLQIVLISVLFGIALLLVPQEKARPLLGFFESLTAAVIKLVEIIMWIAPLGVFALLADTVSLISGDNLSELWSLLGALGFYMLVVLAGLILQVVITYGSLIKFFTPLGIKKFVKGIAPAQLVAFSTSSSGATLPVTMDRVENNLGVSEEVSSFVLPLGATINMDGTALYQAVAAVFIAQTLGIALGFMDQIEIILLAVLASIGTAAVPSAGIIMLIIILQSVGVPAAGIALILGVDRILDMCRTVCNVTGDATVATLVASSEGQIET
ncbi:MAG: dicarboxylate/amino acid:cation symporter [Rhodothermaceae bacterium]|nr:dicarboxylate/amino acid:cation symporter [Rhodothermaceae bacterium]MXZ58987.1 dicarboxylate/amino acid:cation symporter [Rhodothermaceae bacterium]MYB91896.1 dicarboxylate/amino acid:cation symporter [Rhodothermaceae bacterium]MYD67056.1 dicarboxylate/amino acid:cation symporter [Rhodothermaceae bacterium]MYG44475.1 dicarboxylate/amino acid:cation symporter [Rhodothermaceae bacterium]